MIKANVVLDNPIWKKKIKKPNNYIQKRLKILSQLSFFKNKMHEFTLLLTNNKKMKSLNSEFRKKTTTTDVLAFPFNYKVNKNSYLGDVAISYEIIDKRSAKSNFFIEFDKTWIHGYLHLLGYDHKKIKNFKKMNKKENLIINYFYKKN